jgi:hypothetical protein
MLRKSTRHFLAATVTAIVASLFAAGTSVAQTPENYSNTPPGPFHQPVSPYPVEFGFSQDHASTAAEGYLRGKAAVIQARGNFELSKSQADILRQQARWLDRENDLKQTEALLAQKKMWADARIQARKDRDARLAAGQQLADERQATVHRRAYQLSPNDLDPITAEIFWPTILKAEKFEQQRTQIQNLYQQLLGYADPQPETAREIARSVEAWSAALRREFNSMPRAEYMASQKFLLGLKYTAAAPTANVAQSRPTNPQPVASESLANQ